MTPTRTIVAGERRSADKVWDKSVWELEVFPENRRGEWESLEAGLAALLEVFRCREGELHEYRKKYDVCIWCGHFSSSFDGGPALSAEILKAIGDFGIPLYLDTYLSDGSRAR